MVLTGCGHSTDADADEADDAATETEEELEEAKQQLEAKKAIAAKMRQKAADFLAKAEAKAAKNPKKAEQFFAHGQRKALEFEQKAQKMLAHGEAQVQELEQKAAELAVKAEREAILEDLSELIGAASEEEKPELKTLHRLFNKGLHKLLDSELPAATEGQALVLPAEQLAQVLGAEVAIDEETGEVSLAFEKVNITLLAEQPVRVNGIEFTSEQLTMLPSELTPQAAFLRDLMLATVAVDESGNVTVSWPLATDPIDQDDSGKEA